MDWNHEEESLEWEAPGTVLGERLWDFRVLDIPGLYSNHLS